MNCYQHPEREATAYCRTCGRALCLEDQRSIYGALYCPDCVTQTAGPSASAPSAAGIAASPLDIPNPGLALVLGFIPGVGAIYNGQYFKAVLQVLILGFLMIMSGGPGGPIFGMGIAAFWFYMVLDSYRTAKAISLGQPVEEFPGVKPISINAPVGGLILIAMGVLLLLRTLAVFVFSLAILRYVWPAVLIGLGVYLWLAGRERA